VASIAVLPFQFVSGETDDGLQMGLTESLINRLSILKGVSVRPIGAVRKYSQGAADIKALGDELDVDSVLEGNIQRDGSRLRLTVRLLSTRDGKSMWNERIDEDLADIFAIQDKISTRVASSLQIALSDLERSRLSQTYTTSIDAYKKYLAGRHHWDKRNREGFYESIRLYNQAIDLDPVFALAFAGMADSYLLIGLYGIEPTTDAFPKARAAAWKALAIDPDMAEAYVDLAMVEYLFEYDWAKAEEHFSRAVELRPGYATGHHWFGLFLAMHGRTDEALGQLSLAQALDPLSPSISNDIAFAYYLAGHFDNSIGQIEKTLALNSEFANAHNVLGMNYVALGRFDEAFVELERAKHLSDGHFGTYEMIWATALAGKKDQARSLLNSLPENKRSSPFDMALVFASLGENDTAIDLLITAYEQRDPQIVPIRLYPPLRRLHTEPRFVHLLESMKL
jgi:TolB-like protein/Tfp pilus assembly protein PilF